MYEELLARIDAFIKGKLELREFELWVVGSLQRFQDSGDQKAIESLDQVDVLLVQLSDDVIHSQEFANLLLEIKKEGQPPIFRYVEDGHFVDYLFSSTGFASPLLRSIIRYGEPTAGIQAACVVTGRLEPITAPQKFEIEA